MSTIKDVAHAAGVSIASVSRYLSGENVRSAKAIERAIEKLNYRPNSSARGLRMGRHHTVAVIVPDISNPYFAAVVRGIENTFSDDETRVVIASSSESTESEVALIESLAASVDGFVLVPVAQDERTAQALTQTTLPAILVDRTLGDGAPFDQVTVDNAAGARDAAWHLLRLGHERVAVISGPASTLPGRVRREVFAATYADAGHPLAPEMQKVGSFSVEFGHTAMSELMALPQPPTAVFTGNNFITEGALMHLRSCRMTLPRDISLVGFDELPLAELLTPPPTVIVRDAVGEGAAAGKLLIKRMEGMSSAPIAEVLPVALIPRGSTTRRVAAFTTL